MGEQYIVGRSAVLQEQIAQLEKRATSANTAEAVVLGILEKVCKETLSDGGLIMGPRDRCNRGSIFRLKAGRTRLFYIASSKHHRVQVLMLGQRKEGDKRDAYAELARHLNGGRFDADFAALEVTKPEI